MTFILLGQNAFFIKKIVTHLFASVGIIDLTAIGAFEFAGQIWV
jgi:hypothetical protein